MTISTTITQQVYDGDGVTTEFPLQAKVLDKAHLKVIIITKTTGETQELFPSAYSVNGIGNETGVTITYPTTGNPLPVGKQILIRREVPYQQLTDIRNQSGFYPEVVEDALDNLEMQIQQKLDGGVGYVQLPLGESSIKLPPAAKRAGLLLEFDENGKPITRFSVDSIGDIHTINLRGNWAVGQEYKPLDVVYNKGSSYIATTKHTSSSSTEPGAGASWQTAWEVFTEIFPGSITSEKIADGAVRTSKIAENAVTSEKLASDAVSEMVQLAADNTALKSFDGDILVFATGQSNSISSNHDGLIDDALRQVSPLVKSYTRYIDPLTGANTWSWAQAKHGWGQANPLYFWDGNKPAADGSADFPKPVSWPIVFCDMLARETGRNVWLVHASAGHKPISCWSNNTADPRFAWDIGGAALALLRTARNDLVAQGIDVKTTVVLWGQGEDDTTVNIINAGLASNEAEARAWYAQQFIIWTQRWREYRDVLPENTIQVISGLPDGFNDRNDVLFRLGAYNIANTVPVTTDDLSLSLSPNNVYIHYDGPSLHKLGVRAFDAFKRFLGAQKTLVSPNKWLLGGDILTFPERPVAASLLADVVTPVTNGGLKAVSNKIAIGDSGKTGFRIIRGDMITDGVVPSDVTGAFFYATADVTLPDNAVPGTVLTIKSFSSAPIKVSPPVGGKIDSKQMSLVLTANHSAVTVFYEGAASWRILSAFDASSATWI